MWYAILTAVVAVIGAVSTAHPEWAALALVNSAAVAVLRLITADPVK